MRSGADLERELARIDGRGYKAYKDVAGRWELGPFLLCIDRVQGDPFAAPSKLRLRLPRERAAIPAALSSNRVRRIACEDALAREVASAIGPGRRSAGSGRSGVVQVDAGGQAVLERTAVRLTDAFVEARLEVGLPAAGRRVLGGAATRLLCRELPQIAERGLLWSSLDAEAIVGFVECVENQEALRDQLAGRGLVAFVAEGSILPRASGVSELPLPAAEAVPFRAPEGLRVELPVPNPVAGTDGGARSHLVGMGVPEGVTLVVGGGYHGKSTLLRALERAVHPHVPGDGREGVATRRGAVKIRAEDGRRVEGVDIRAFVADLPGGRSTRAFRSEDASGSTSQAAGIVEAIEAGASALLIDEDTAATNLMVRDARMQELVHAADEPITPLVDRVRELHASLGISTVLVMGGCGDYFDVADTVIALREYVPAVVTDRAREIAAAHATGRRREVRAPLAAPAPRVPDPRSVDPSKGRRELRVAARGTEELEFGSERIDLRGVDQLLDPSQLRALGQALGRARADWMDGRAIPELLDAFDAFVDEHGLDALPPRRGRSGDAHPGNLARPRRFELAAALNRLRTLRVE